MNILVTYAVTDEQKPVRAVEQRNMPVIVSGREYDLKLDTAEIEYRPLSAFLYLIPPKFGQIGTRKGQPYPVSLLVEHTIPHLCILPFKLRDRVRMAVHAVETAISIAVVGMCVCVDDCQRQSARKLIAKSPEISDSEARVDQQSCFRADYQIHPKIPDVIRVLFAEHEHAVGYPFDSHKSIDVVYQDCTSVF